MTPQEQGRLVLGTTRRQWLSLGAVAAVLAALVLAAWAGRASDPFRQVSDPVDLGFARDMSTHHAQAVEMSSIVYLRTSDARLRYLAFDIMTSQQGQIGTMHGWLRLWHHSVSDSAHEVLDWMGTASPGHMAGMAAQSDVAALRSLPVARMEEQFLRLMVRHHRGAVPMAEYAAAHAQSSAIRDLAGKMASGQAAEVDLMQGMLVERGLAREPEGSEHAGMTMS